MSYYTSLAMVLGVFMLFWFGIAVVKRRNDVADIAWGLGFILMAWTSFYVGRASIVGAIVGLLVTIWGVRLARHIYRRNHGKPEDARYQAWRTAWGSWFYLRSFFQVFVLQGVLLYVIALPVIYINSRGADQVTGWMLVGMAVWLGGCMFEAISDRQLARFIANPKNKGVLMTSGLWSYSRHPNYFGEVMLWWGLYIVALGIPGGWVTIIGPATISILIGFVSGVPLLEKKYAGRQDFEAYKQRTSVFFPWPPKQA